MDNFKKLFISEDGKIKTFNTVILITIIFIVLVFLIYILFLKDNNVTSGGHTVTSKSATSKIAACKGCAMKFNANDLLLETNSEYYMDELLALKGINVKNVKFEIDDPTLAKVTLSDRELVLKISNKIGTTNIKATYADLEAEATIVISQGEIVSLKLLDHPYYVYLDKETDIEVDSDPLNVDLTDMDITSSDESILSINNGKMTGKQLGETKIYLNYKEEVQEQVVYVVNNKIDVQIKNKAKLEDVYKIEVDNKKHTKEIEVVVTMDDNTNEGYTNSNLVIEHIDDGITGVVEYNGINLGKERSYKYLIKINEINDMGKMTIRFKHPDGTIRELLLYDLEDED